MNDGQENLPATRPHPSEAPSPFTRLPALGGGVNAGSVAIESERAIAEVQGQIIVAQRFRRSMAAAHADFMEACKSPEFAAKAFYTVPNRGTGPSIRFAEEVARCYGNFQYGHRELSRTEGKSEVEVFAWDVEKNNRSIRQITVMHVLDTRDGPKKLRDQADIDNRIANIASKQVRGRIMALVPKSLTEAGIAECKKTIAGNNDKPIGQRVRDMTGAFAKFGVTVKHLEERLGHGLDDTTLDELIDLTGVFNAIKEGAKPSEYFSLKEAAAESKDAGKAAAIADASKKGNAAAPAKTPSPGPAAAPAETPVRAVNNRPARTSAEGAGSAAKAPPPPPAAEQRSSSGADEEVGNGQGAGDGGDLDVF